jgi:transcriptional regulator with XRE-family HTH domain
MLSELPLDELRAAQHLTQAEIAKKLDVSQASISQLESQADIYLSTLDRYVTATGGRLELRAVFPTGEVKHIKLSGPKGSERVRAKRVRMAATAERGR